jgi:hypothetical protein
MSGWTVAWLLWGLMFTVIEAPAILNRTKGDTLSEHVWRWGAIKTKPKGWQLRRFGLLTSLTYMLVHFLTGWV